MELYENTITSITLKITIPSIPSQDLLYFVNPSRLKQTLKNCAAMRIPPRLAFNAHGRGFSALRLEPPKAPRSAVILLHGLGDTAEGWLSGAYFLLQGLPETRFLLLGW